MTLVARLEFPEMAFTLLFLAYVADASEIPDDPRERVRACVWGGGPWGWWGRDGPLALGQGRGRPGRKGWDAARNETARPSAPPPSPF